MSNTIITEVIPLQPTDCFYMKDRYKDYFSFPLHQHKELELNFVENCQGAMRIVGDSACELGHVDLALIGSGVAHAWEQHNCRSAHIREITLQFSPDLICPSQLSRTAFEPIRRMLDTSPNGLAFPLPTIMRVYSKIMDLTVMQGGFNRMLKLMEILNDLATAADYQTLNTPETRSEAQTGVDDANARVAKVRSYVRENYRREMRLPDIAALVGMTPTAFSRFFKVKTGRSITDYIIDTRLSHATRQLVDSDKPVAEICFECGFKNVSNFNRIFKKKKGTSPNTFRHLYQRRKAII